MRIVYFVIAQDSLDSLCYTLSSALARAQQGLERVPTLCVSGPCVSRQGSNAALASEASRAVVALPMSAMNLYD